MKDTNQQLKKSKEPTTHGHVLISLQWPDKKRQISFKKTIMSLTADFMKMMKARSQWKDILNNIFHVMI